MDAEDGGEAADLEGHGHFLVRVHVEFGEEEPAGVLGDLLFVVVGYVVFVWVDGGKDKHSST